MPASTSACRVASASRAAGRHSTCLSWKTSSRWPRTPWRWSLTSCRAVCLATHSTNPATRSHSTSSPSSTDLGAFRHGQETGTSPDAIGTGPVQGGPAARPVGGRIGEVSMQGVVLVAVLVALGVISAITLGAVHELAKQNGRLLLRLDELERRLGPDLSS